MSDDSPAFVLGMGFGALLLLMGLWIGHITIMVNLQSDCAKQHNVFTCHQVVTWVPGEK